MQTDIVIDEYKYEENFIGVYSDLKVFFKNIELELFNDKLLIEGQNVIIPKDELLNVKIKFDVDDNYSFAIKVTWKRNIITANEAVTTVE